MLYLVAEDVISINQRIIGEGSILLDPNSLHSAILRPQTAAHYANADLAGQAATLISGIAANHPFLDGNKRTAAIAGLIFLEANGFQLQYLQFGPNRPTDEFGDQILAFVTHNTTIDHMADWIRRHMVIQPEED